MMVVVYLQSQLTETTVGGQTCCSTLTHYPDSESTSLSAFSLMLCAWRRSNKYQFYSLWFDPIWSQTHDLPHLRRAREPIHHRCGSHTLKCLFTVIYLYYRAVIENCQIILYMRCIDMGNFYQQATTDVQKLYFYMIHPI